MDIGLEEGLGDTVEVQGPDIVQVENMEIDRGPNYAAGANTSVRSPHEQMVPSMCIEAGRITVRAASSYAAEQGSNERKAPENERAHVRQIQGHRLQPPSATLQGGNNDTDSTAESTSVRRDQPQADGVGLTAWSRHGSTHSTMCQDDSQVPLVPELCRRVLSRRHNRHSLPIVNLEAIGATKTS